MTSAMGTFLRCALAVLLAGAGCLGSAPLNAAEPDVRVNPFHDPFKQVTHGLPGCPAPSPPTYSQHDMHLAEHHRVEQGNSCFLAGRCRLSNSFLYDKGIASALFPRLAADRALEGSSVWVLVQGRFVQFFGCVSHKGQIEHLQAIARQTPDVQAVLANVMVGIDSKPPYSTASPSLNCGQPLRGKGEKPCRTPHE
ncbi:MAG: BON domain-containing protein [Betaproteobacteria bacterium]|nr:BON domain-containing protein [Betaproteobacteria bacterium]